MPEMWIHVRSSSSSNRSSSSDSHPSGADIQKVDSHLKYPRSRPELLWIGQRGVKIRGARGLQQVVIPMPAPADEACIEWMTRP